MELIKIEAVLHKYSIDAEGEVTLVLKVSQKYKEQIIKIPEQTALAVGITEFLPEKERRDSTKFGVDE